MGKASNTMKKLVKDFEKIAPEALNQSVTRRLSEQTAEQIKKRTRLGYGVSAGSEQQRLKPLSEGYKGQRKRYSDNLSETTTANKSNLTATGQMLDGIKGKGATGRIELSIEGSRSKSLTGRSKSTTNSKIASYVQEQGRRFFGLTSPEQKKLVAEIKQLLLTQYRKILK